MSMVRSDSVSSLKRSQYDNVSAIEAADEFMSRAWSGSPCETSSSVWGKDMHVINQANGPRLAPRSFQSKSEATAVRRIRRRANKSGVDHGGVKWGRLLVWLPGGTRVSLDLYGDKSLLDDTVIKNPIEKHTQLGEAMPQKRPSVSGGGVGGGGGGSEVNSKFHTISPIGSPVTSPGRRRSSVGNSPDKHVEIEEDVASGILHSAPNQVCIAHVKTVFLFKL